MALGAKNKSISGKGTRKAPNKLDKLKESIAKYYAGQAKIPVPLPQKKV